MKKAFGVSSWLFAFFALFLMQGCLKGESEQAKTTPKKDLLNHPVYSKYEFSKAENIINFGSQPITTYGPLIEAMRHDAVLRDALSTLGMEIRFYSFRKGSDSNFFFGRGDIDGGMAGDMPVISAASKFDIVIPALVKLGFGAIIANQHMMVRDLRGMRVGFPYGTTAHYGMLEALASEGIIEGQVKITTMDVTELPESLHKGEIDAFASWEPTPTLTLKKYKEAVVIYRYPSPGFIYFSRDFSKKHPEALRHILAAEVRAIRWMQSDKENLLRASELAMSASEKLIGKKSLLSIEERAELTRSDILMLAESPVIPERLLKYGGQIHREFEFLKNIGKIPASAEWEQVHASFDRQILKEVLANQEKYDLNEFRYEINGYDNQ